MGDNGRPPVESRLDNFLNGTINLAEQGANAGSKLIDKTTDLTLQAGSGVRTGNFSATANAVGEFTLMNIDPVNILARTPLILVINPRSTHTITNHVATRWLGLPSPYDNAPSGFNSRNEALNVVFARSGIGLSSNLLANHISDNTDLYEWAGIRTRSTMQSLLPDIDAINPHNMTIREYNTAVQNVVNRFPLPGGGSDDSHYFTDEIPMRGSSGAPDDIHLVTRSYPRSRVLASFRKEAVTPEQIHEWARSGGQTFSQADGGRAWTRGNNFASFSELWVAYNRAHPTRLPVNNEGRVINSRQLALEIQAIQDRGVTAPPEFTPTNTDDSLAPGGLSIPSAPVAPPVTPADPSPLDFLKNPIVLGGLGIGSLVVGAATGSVLIPIFGVLAAGAGFFGDKLISGVTSTPPSSGVTPTAPVNVTLPAVEMQVTAPVTPQVVPTVREI